MRQTWSSNGNKGDGAAIVPPDVDAAAVEPAAIDPDVAEHEHLRLGIALEIDGQRPAHGAARPVRADEIAHARLFLGAVGALQRGSDAGAVLGEAGKLGTALDLGSQHRQPGGEDRLGARLRQQQRIGIGAVDALAHGERRQLPAAVADHEPVEAHAVSQELLDDAHGLQRLEAAAPHRQRLGDRRRRGVAVDDAHRDAMQAQHDGEGQAGRPGARDEKRCARSVRHRSPRRMKRPRPLRAGTVAPCSGFGNDWRRASPINSRRRPRLNPVFSSALQPYPARRLDLGGGDQACLPHCRPGGRAVRPCEAHSVSSRPALTARIRSSSRR